MRPRFLLLAAVIAAVIIPSATANARVSDYRFSQRSGSYSAISGTTYAYASYGVDANGYYGDAAIAGPISIGFTFRLDCTDYTTFGLNVHGNIVLGRGGLNQPNNSITGSAAYPIIAPFWDTQWLYGYCGTNNIQAATTGSVGSRILTVQWNTQYYGWCGAYYSYQVKLFEGSNKIEFHYGSMYQYTATSATIGVAQTSSDYLSVTPGSPATASSTSPNNSVYFPSTPITSGTIYTFDPSAVDITGRTGPGNGGTALAANGDTFFSGFTEQLGNRATYTPLSLRAFTCAANVVFSMSITGPAAMDYAFATTGTQAAVYTVSGASSIVPQIYFTPTRVGLRSATMNLTNTQTGETRSYTLAASGTPRTAFVGNPGSGGVSPLRNGDTLMSNVLIARLSSITMGPVSVQYTNAAPTFSAAPVTVTATIDSAGGLSDQYMFVHPITGLLVSTVTAVIGPGQTFTPQIRFTALSAGIQYANYTITTSDGDRMSFVLAAVSNAPGGAFTFDNAMELNRNFIYANQVTCVGEQSLTVPIHIRSMGVGPLTVNSITFYGVDTTVRQGVSPYPLSRDANGQLTVFRDYRLSSTPGGPAIAYPFIIPQGQTNTYYLTYTGTYPGRRWARGFVNSTAENFSNLDTSAAGRLAIGSLWFDVLASSMGSLLAADASGTKLKPVVLQHTRVGDTSEAAFTIANAGACDLRIKRNRFRITSGDVNEIKLVQALTNANFDAATGDYVLAPGVVDTIRVRFIPSRSGTRMARLWIQTNDSTIVNPGITERGAYYLDITGRGLAGLDAIPLVLDPVVIGNFVRGVARLENSLNIPVGVQTIYFEGDDAAEFTEDNVVPWPTRPFIVAPGQKLNLGVRMSPAGAAGIRRTTLVLVTTSNDTVRLPINGEAGTQTLVVSPTSLFDNISIAIGQSFRQNVVIANNGTLPVLISSMRIIGPDSLSYRLGLFPRRNIEAGHTEHLEVTYAPTTPGQSSATLEIMTSTGVVYTVALGGNALKIRRDPIDPAVTSQPVDHGTMQQNPGRHNGPTLR